MPLASLLLYSGCSFDENEGGCVRSESHVCRSMQTEIFSIVSDREGATLFMDPAGVEMFKRAVRSLSSQCPLTGLQWIRNDNLIWNCAG